MHPVKLIVRDLLRLAPSGWREAGESPDVAGNLIAVCREIRSGNVDAYWLDADWSTRAFQDLELMPQSENLQVQRRPRAKERT